MKLRHINDVVRLCRAWLPKRWLPETTRHSKGQVAIYMAMILTSLMGLAGAGIDYGMIVIDSARLQHALDAASLAGARALVVSTASTQANRNAEGQAAAKLYLEKQGYTVGTPGSDTTVTTGTSPNTVTWACATGTNTAPATTFTFCKSASETAGSNDTMKVTGVVSRATTFWKVIGINSTTLNQNATAVASGGMVDVMLSLDLTGSMEMSGTNDLVYLRQAVVAFIQQMQLSTTDPRGSQVGIARWAGVNCSWTRGTVTVGNTRTPTPTGADGDRNIDFNHGPSTSTGEYTTPCYDDATVLTYLSQNQPLLQKIADGSNTGVACPTAPAAPSTPTPYSPGAMSGYGCPLASWRYPVGSVPQVGGGTPTTATGVEGHSPYTSFVGYTGTKLSNSIKIVNGSLTGCYAWANSASGCPTNGRNNVAGEGLARKVLVIMTDGFSQSGTEGLPSGYPNYNTVATPSTSLPAPSGWDDEAIDLATRLKRGWDNDITTTADNVEIYVVGFFCVHYNDNDESDNWCRSYAADTGSITPTGNTHPCPAASLPSAGSHTFSYSTNSIQPGVDEILNKISSSTPGTCDHYFPISKSEGSQLPQLFRVMAGSIARGRLQ